LNDFEKEELEKIIRGGQGNMASYLINWYSGLNWLAGRGIDTSRERMNSVLSEWPDGSSDLETSNMGSIKKWGAIGDHLFESFFP